MVGLLKCNWSRRLRLALATLLALGWLAALPPAPAGAAEQVFTVTKLDDTNGTCASGTDCSLREAIKAAEATTDHDTIKFAAGLTGTITLTSGLGTVTRALSIEGPDRDALTIEGNQTFPLLWVNAPGATVSLSALTLKGGRASFYGGNLRSMAVGSISLTDVALVDGRAEANQGGAGAYFGGGIVTLTRVLVSGNEAPGILWYNTGAGLYFDEVYGPLTATIADSAIVGNTSTGYNGGGIAMQRNSGDPARSLSLSLTNTDVGTVGLPNTAPNGGGLFVAGGTLTLTNSRVTGNHATVYGGGLYLWHYDLAGEVSATLDSSAVSDNQAGFWGGGAAVFTSVTGENPILTLAGSTIGNNRASNSANQPTFGGGLFVRNMAPDGGRAVTLTGSTVSGNGATIGGGLYLYNSSSGTATATFTNSTVSDNKASDAGGLMVMNGGTDGSATATLTGGSVSGNQSGDTAGGLYALNLANGGSASLSLTGVTVSGNTTGRAAGGILVDNGAAGSATATLTDSTVTGNQAGNDGGGGIYVLSTVADANASATLTGSTVSDNTTTGDGGGLRLRHYDPAGTASATITNSTVSGNEADGSGGGLYLDPFGGAATLAFATITGNVADNDSTGTGTGGGIFRGGGTATAGSSIVAGNRTGAGVADDCGGGIASQGYTLWGDQTACLGGNPVGTGDLDLVTLGQTILQVLDPALMDNGGPTPTHRLVPGSPALDNGDDANCPGTDQRDLNRPQAAGCDIGAYEGRVFTLATTVAGTGTATISPASGPQLEGSTVAVTVTPTGGSGFVGWTLDGNPAGTTNPLAVAMTGDRNVIAFTAAPGPVTLTVGTAGTGSGTVGRAPAGTGGGPYSYPYGTVVTLTASPGPGSTFANWAVDGSPVGSTNPLQVTLTANRTVVATFTLSAPSPSPSPTALLSVTTSGAGSVGRDRPGSGDGPFAYTVGTTVALTPQPGAGQAFVGWVVDGANRGWADPLTITMDANHTVQASFVPTASFPDVGSGRTDHAAIVALATRGTIKGYQDGRYGPGDRVSRSQMAALIARATPLGPGTPTTLLTPPACLVAGTWDCEVWNAGFTDQEGTDPNLWRNAGTLAHYQVARGYTADDCVARGRVAPCYGPHDAVTYAQTISFVTRAMVAKGYWAAQPGAALPYADVPAAHAADVRTFHFYTAAGGGVPAPPADWNAGATRGWFAQALWQALNSYWGSDNAMPDGRPAGGQVP